MFISIDIKLYFVFNEVMAFREQKHPDDNRINPLIQWLQCLNIRKSQLIMPSASISSLMEQSPILRFLLIMFSALLLVNSSLDSSTQMLGVNPPKSSPPFPPRQRGGGDDTFIKNCAKKRRIKNTYMRASTRLSSAVMSATLPPEMGGEGGL